MKKLNFLIVVMLAVVSMPALVNGQKLYNFDENWYIDYVGERILVNSPANIAGPATYTITNDGVSNGEWGQSVRGLANPIINVDVIQAAPYEACAAITNGAALSGKIAIVKRGNCEFGAKAKAVQDAGAIACIIVNNASGGPVGMGAGAQGANVTIPVIMVSDVDGAAIVSEIGNGGVKMSMTPWSNGFNNDLGILKDAVALSHSYTIPLNQIKSTASAAYKNIDAAVIANFGSTTATNVVLKSTLTWTPTGGSASVVRTDSVTVASFAPGDSILTPIIPTTYSLNPTTTGKYNVKYELTAGNFTDDFHGDNVDEYDFYITDRIYSKGRYDMANNTPQSTIGFTTVNSSDNSRGNFMWGPLYFMEQADYQFEKASFAVTQDGGGAISSGDVFVYIWEWVDQSNDSLIQIGELNVVGLGKKTYQTGDTSGQVFTVDIKDANDGVSILKTKANTWYWVTVEVPRDRFLNCDGIKNYFVRSWARSYATDQYREAFAPLFGDVLSGLESAKQQQPTGLMGHFPFAGTNLAFNVDSTRYTSQKRGLVPSVPLQMSLFTVGVENVEAKSAFGVSLYPNPAADVINATINLDKKANKIQYKLVNPLGSIMFNETHENVSGTDTYSVSTSELPAGNYFMVIDVDDNIQVRKFTVMK